MLPIDQHFCISLILWILGVFEVALVGIEIDVEHAGFGFVLVVGGGDVGEVGSGLEEGGESVDDEEDDEDVVEIEPALLLLAALGLLPAIPAEGVAEWGWLYV
jgi:hypothetical protein